jgi:hypothetical protein
MSCHIIRFNLRSPNNVAILALCRRFSTKIQHANPAMALGTLALDACKQAAAEYPKRHLPSWETVLRNMKTILAESRPPVP